MKKQFEKLFNVIEGIEELEYLFIVLSNCEPLLINKT